MTPVGPEPELVVQIRAHKSFGTGYRIGPGLVLTAAHVVAAGDESPAGVTVSRPGQTETAGEVVWHRRDAAVDAALIRLDPRPGEGMPHRAPLARYGSFVSAQPDQRVEAIGFPRLQKYESLRDQQHFSGLLSPATGAASGHYECTSTTPLPGSAAGETRTPWAGMSGAAVFSGGLLVGVVRQDRRARTGTLLTATPLSTLLADDVFRRTLTEATGREPVHEPVELSGFLESPYPNRDVRSAASLLRADAETVTFHGRQTVRAHLVSWCAGPEATAVQIVTGQGGEGKSRLARWLLARQRAHGWTTGLLRPTLTDEAVTEERFGSLARTRGPLLIAVDYAENHPRQARALLRAALAAQGPVRLLLLARERGVWAEALDEPDPDVRDMLADAPVLALDPLAAGHEDWNASFRHSLRDLAKALRGVPGHEGRDWSAVAEQVTTPSEETHHRADSALGIQMTALTLLLQQAAPVTVVRGEPVERTLLRHEEAYWTRAARRSGLRGFDHTTLKSAVAALHLVTVADRAQAVTLLDALGVRDDDRGRIAARWLHELYPPGPEGYCGHVQPDRLAEFLLVTACSEEDDLLTRIVSAAAHCGDPRRAAPFAAHLGQGDDGAFGQMMALREAVRAARSQAHFGNPVRPLLDQIERTASLPVISDVTLSWAISNTQTLPLPGRKQNVRKNADGSLTITGILDEAAAALAIAGYRRGAQPLVTDDTRQQGFVHMMHSLTLSQLGRAEEALALSARAAESFRSAPDSEADLAAELRRQAELLLGLGRDDEAVDALREEVRLRESMDPAQAERELRSALDLLVLTLCQAGRFTEALPYSRKETVLLGRRAGAARDTAGPYLIALGRYAQVLEGVGELAEALVCCTQAQSFLAGLPVPVLDELVAERARLAETTAQVHSGLDDGPASAAAWLESALLWKRLDAPFQELDPATRAVMGFNNAAVGYQALGRLTRSSEIIREAVDLALGERGAALRRDHPELYERAHATYVGHLVLAKRPEDALREAERLQARPAPSPTPLPAHFANSLREAALALASSGRLSEATRASGIAVAALDALDPPPASDQQLSVLMAAALSDHSANLAETGRHAEGAEAAGRAAGLWRRVGAAQPAMRINLATSLANQGMCLHLGARPAEAARVYGEAADVLRELTRGTRRELPMFADILGRQASCHTEAGDHAAAATTRSEEADIRYALWRSDPAAGPAAAQALTELSMALQELGDFPTAVTAAQTAVGLYGQAYGPRPDDKVDEISRALLVYGMALLKNGEAAKAVAPFLNAMKMCVETGALDRAAACGSAIELARAMDPIAVAAEWKRLGL